MSTALDDFNLETGIDLFPVSDSLTSVRFKHKHGVALVVGLVGLVGVWAAWTYIPHIVGRIIFALAALVIAFQGIAASRYRYEVRFDPVRRKWYRRMGMVSSVSSDSGSMEDLKGVVLKLVYETTTRDGSTYTVATWKVLLEMKGEAWTEPLIVGVTREEQEGYRLLEKYAKLLRVDAVDRTHDEELRRSWEEVDRAVADGDGAAGAWTRPAAGVAATLPQFGPANPERTAPMGSLDGPPADSEITVTMVDGYRRITVGPAGSPVANVIQLIMGLPFAGIAVGLLLYTLQPVFDGTPLGDVLSADLVTILVGGVFLATGLLMAFRGAMGLGAREWVMDGLDRLSFGITGPLGTSRRRWLYKREIEEVAVVSTRDQGGEGRLYVVGLGTRSLTPDPDQAGYVRIRTDKEIEHIAMRLSPEGREWLRGALQAMIQR